MSAPATHAVRTADDVAPWLAERRGPVRLRGSGSRQAGLADTPADTVALDLSGLDAIVRLDPGDQTCTVECGVTRQALDAELSGHGLELPCLGDGTIGGLFASDPFGAAAIPAQSPRSLLLGIDAVLADGTCFKSGARVVKSVAGFDVHKLLVGSEGRLFTALRLHLRLKPRPRSVQWFSNTGLDADRAVELTHALRQGAFGPDVLQLHWQRDGNCTVAGRLAGREGPVSALRDRFGLDASDMTLATASRANASPDVGELVEVSAPPSTMPTVLAAAAEVGADSVAWLGGGRGHVHCPDRSCSDRLLAAFEAAELPARRRRHGAQHPAHHDSATDRIQAGLKAALDPDGKFV